MFRPNSHTHYLLIALGILIPCLAYEIFLRAIGYLPFSPRNYASIFRNPSVYQDDNLLGWRLIPGEHTFLPITSQARETQALVLQDGSRATYAPHHSRRLPPQGNILFVGDSFTFGDGLNDHETYPWLVQENLPEYSVHNFGVPGYGTCQIYKSLKLLLESGAYDNATIIYGMSAFHESRNVPTMLVAWQFAAKSSKKSYQTPSCFLDSLNQVQISSPIRYFDPFPLLTENLSIARRFTHFVFQIREPSTPESRRALSYALLAELQKNIHPSSRSTHGASPAFRERRGSRVSCFSSRCGN